MPTRISGGASSNLRQGYVGTGEGESFSTVMDPNNPDEDLRNIAEEAPEEEEDADFTYLVDGNGRVNVVDMENPAVLEARMPGSTTKEREALAGKRARYLDRHEAERARRRAAMEGMGSAERDAFMRFSDLDL